MAIGDIRDARCDLCDELVWDRGWELHEVIPGEEWITVCDLCERVTEISEGK